VIKIKDFDISSTAPTSFSNKLAPPGTEESCVKAIDFSVESFSNLKEDQFRCHSIKQKLYLDLYNNYGTA
jgi:hypothetical protein